MIKPRQLLSRWKRLLAESIGVERYSWPGLNGLDRAVVARLGEAGGFFIEAGANDGYTQSNTYYLERFRGWTGILVEPVPELCARCRRERPCSVVVQAALADSAREGGEIEIAYAGLMSVSDFAFADAATRARHVEEGLRVQEIEASRRMRVPAITLSRLIDRHAGGREVDLLSLDVEGAELVALSGLDMKRHAPRHVLVETRSAGEVITTLAEHYADPIVLNYAGEYQDLFFSRR